MFMYLYRKETNKQNTVMKNTVKKTIVESFELIYDGEQFIQSIETKNGADQTQIKTWEKMVREDIEQHIVEKWLDNQSYSKKMSHDKRMNKEGAEIDKMNQMPIIYKRVEAVYDLVIKFQPQIIDRSFGHVFWKTPMYSKSIKDANESITKKMYTDAMENEMEKNDHPSTLTWHIQEVETWKGQNEYGSRMEFVK